MDNEKKFTNMSRFTIHEFNRLYPDDEACFMEISRRKLGENFACPVCTRQMYRRYNRRFWQCKKDHRISPLVGTVFQGTHISLKNWFYAIYYLSTNKQGTSANRLSQELGISYTATLKMLNKIRALMDEEHTLGGFNTEVEIDEAYVGGVQKGFKGRHATGVKHCVLGMVERGGRVKTVVVPNDLGESLLPQIKKYVKKGTSIYTDGLPTYGALNYMGYSRTFVNHTKELVTEDGVNTNTIEGFWSHMKGGIRGTYKHVSKQHMPVYAAEYAWRYSHRNDQVPRFELLFRLSLN